MSLQKKMILLFLDEWSMLWSFNEFHIIQSESLIQVNPGIVSFKNHASILLILIGKIIFEGSQKTTKRIKFSTCPENWQHMK